jgi:hypothetical protein
MSAKQVLDGINTIRDIVNHPNMSAEEKIQTLKNTVEGVRNDIQDLTDQIFANYAQQAPDAATDNEVEAVYQQLVKQEITDLLFFYKRSVFASLKSGQARAALAGVLIRIAKEKETAPSTLWLNIAASAGEMNEE